MLSYNVTQRAQQQGNQTQPRTTLDPSCLNDVRYVSAFCSFSWRVPFVPIHHRNGRGYCASLLVGGNNARVCPFPPACPSINRQHLDLKDRRIMNDCDFQGELLDLTTGAVPCKTSVVRPILQQCDSLKLEENNKHFRGADFTAFEPRLRCFTRLQTQRHRAPMRRGADAGGRLARRCSADKANFCAIAAFCSA